MRIVGLSLSALLAAACARGAVGTGDPVPEAGPSAQGAAARPGRAPAGAGDARAEDGARRRESADAASAAARPALETRTGVASYYADRLHGRLTASGIPYDKEALIAAHRSYPFGTVLRVTNLDNRRSVVVRVVDRGPFVDGRIIDLSRRAAELLGFILEGLARVRVEVLEFGSGAGGGQ